MLDWGTFPPSFGHIRVSKKGKLPFCLFCLFSVLRVFCLFCLFCLFFAFLLPFCCLFFAFFRLFLKNMMFFPEKMGSLNSLAASYSHRKPFGGLLIVINWRPNWKPKWGASGGLWRSIQCLMAFCRPIGGLWAYWGPTEAHWGPLEAYGSPCGATGCLFGAYGGQLEACGGPLGDR